MPIPPASPAASQVLTVVCRSRRGIVAAVAGFLGARSGHRRRRGQRRRAVPPDCR